MNHHETENSLAEELKKQSVLQFIRNEIIKITTKSKRSGWSTWALFGGLAASSTYLAKQIKDPHMTWDNVSILFVFLYISYTIIIPLKNLINGNDKSSGTDNRFEILSTNLKSSRLSMVALMALEFSIWKLVKIQGLSSYVIKGYIGFQFVATAIVFIDSFLHIPMPKRICNGHVSFRIVLAIIPLLLLGGYSFTILFQEVFNAGIPVTIYDWETSITITVITLLILLLLRNNEVPYLLSDLEDIERQLSLSQISAKEAQAQLDIVLYGITLGSYFEPEVQRNISSLRDLEKMAQQVNEKATALEEVVDDVFSGNVAVDKALTLISALSESISTLLEKGNSLRTRINKQKERLSFKLQIAQKLSPNCTDELTALIDGIDDIEQSITKHSNEFTERYQKVEKRIKAVSGKSEAKPLLEDKTEN